MKKSQATKIKKRIAGKASTRTRRLGYLKFLPAVLILGFSVYLQAAPSFASATNAANSVLGYATSVSPSGLLSSTNTERAANGVAALSANSALNNAAQAKANDMVARNYWSHATPDGQQPWIFITQAGYSYKAAGENLAYGFATSSATVTGWMNSPPHRENLLKTTFYDVGFGIANSPNFVGYGEQTVVVAMYGAPQSSYSPAPAAPTSPTPAPPAAKAVAPAAKTAPITAPIAAEPIETVPVPEPTPENATNEEAVLKDESLAAPATAAPVQVEHIQLLTGGNAIWSTTLLIISLPIIGLLWILHHGLNVRRMILSGEHFVVRHLHLDLTIAAIFVLGWTLLSTSGTIR